MKQKVFVNGKSYDIEITDVMSSPVEVFVDGKKFIVEIENQQQPTSQNDASSMSPGMLLTPPSPTRTQKQEPQTQSNDNKDDLKAPMPGTILNIMVKAGDKVAVGETVCFLEAMKMKNAIKSPRQAMIASVEVSEGQKVAFGDTLIKFA